MSIYIYLLCFVYLGCECSALPSKNQLNNGTNLDQNINSTTISNDLNTTITEKADNVKEKVLIQLYYECLCPFCTHFYTEVFIPTIREIGDYLDVRTYPYGNAWTNKRNGSYVFDCQHGRAECYGNKLHACALDLLQNKTQALVFNSCLMEGNSDDSDADYCGKNQNVDADSIKECAKGNKGTLLLKYYGDESAKGQYNYVPYLVINGEHRTRSNFMYKVCKIFTVTPPPCVEVLKSEEDNK
ncbi:PREDICTED: gamma-interferon-inducible lysosomal thiol reductase-like [Papilio xuthus]|uniref:Gamma-interferon-inducible lysosomal thiol reductase-like n=2 Tax=Papilio xuthus TaxID=66420 RepID=A0AAJ7EH51_PAPXU|nr:PREDICTED: gamma-interferon-inducible lysosomal thiol reductase-like [Papilio xuthus]